MQITWVVHVVLNGEKVMRVRSEWTVIVYCWTFAHFIGRERLYIQYYKDGITYKVLLSKHMLEYNTGPGIRGSQYYSTGYGKYLVPGIAIKHRPTDDWQGQDTPIGGQKYGGEIALWCRG